MKIRNLVLSLCILSISSTCLYAVDVYRTFHEKDEDHIHGFPISKIDTFLNDETPAVTDKTMDVPGVDKHDYVSFDPYYWPNENSPNAPYVRIDGKRNKELVNQGDGPRFQEMASKVILLIRTYKITMDEKYAEKAVEFIRTWFLNPETKMNPNLDHGHMIMGAGDGRASSITEVRYNISLVELYPILLGSKHWTQSDHQHLKDWYRSYYTWLISSKKGVEAATTLENNHGSWYDAQLMSIAIFLDRKEFAKKIAQNVRKRRIAKQIEPDGKQPMELKRTRGLFYSLFNLEALYACAALAEKVGVDLWNYQTKDGRSIQGAYDYIKQFRDSSVPFPYKQIHEVQPWVWEKLDDRHYVLKNIFR